jgi:hypothetical protein
VPETDHGRETPARHLLSRAYQFSAQWQRGKEATVTIDSTANIVLVACTATGELVPTGFWADTLDELEPENELIDCPACGSDHAWSRSDAVLGWGAGTREAGTG